MTSEKDTLTRKEEYFELVSHFLGFSLTFPSLKLNFKVTFFKKKKPECIPIN